MKLPSSKAADLAEAVMDHVGHHLTRADSLRELAEMIDENNCELVEAAAELLADSDRRRGLPAPHCLSRLRQALLDYRPLRLGADDQTDLFEPASRTARPLG